MLFRHVAVNGNRTEWSPVQPVIIRVINITGRNRAALSDLLITSVIPDRNGRYKVLSPTNHSHYNFREQIKKK